MKEVLTFVQVQICLGFTLLTSLVISQGPLLVVEEKSCFPDLATPLTLFHTNDLHSHFEGTGPDPTSQNL